MNGVIGALLEYQAGTAPGRQNVVTQVDPVSLFPDSARNGPCFFVRQVGISVEVREWITKGSAAQSEEAIDIPAPDELIVSIDID